jgi:hypothetical protein
LEERVKYRILISTVCIILAGLAASPASAENPFYLLGKIGDTSTDDDLGQRFQKVIDGDDGSWSLGLGLHLGRFLVFQAEYHELGEAPGRGSPCPDSEENCIEILVPLAAESSALSVTFLPHLPLTKRIFIYGKVGVVAWESEVDRVFTDTSQFIEEYDEEDLLYGAGLRFNFLGPFGIFVEYEKLADPFDTVAVGATFGF